MEEEYDSIFGTPEVVSAPEPVENDEEYDSVFGEPEVLKLPNQTFTGEEYGTVPSVLNRLVAPLIKNFTDANMVGGGQAPIPNLDLDNPILLELSQSEEFKNAGQLKQQQMIANAIRDRNQQIYEDAGGEETLGGFGPKVQKVITEDLEEDTVTVPSPATAERGLVGEGAVANALVSGLQRGADSFASIFGADELVPTKPPASGLEDVSQEIIGILIGTAAGMGTVDRLMKIPGMTSKTANYLAKGYAKLKGKKPEEVAEGMQLLLRGAALEAGAVTGASLTTPQDSETLVGGDIVEAFGFDPDENRLLSVFADNAAFSGVVLGLGATVRKGFGLLGKIADPGKLNQKVRNARAAAEFIRTIDPLASDVSGARLANRAQIFGEVIQNNKSFNAEFLANADITTDTTTAIMRGARDYVERAYLHRKGLMSADEWTAFVNKQTEDIAGRMIDLKRSRMESPIVRSKDAEMTGEMQGAFLQTANELGGAEATQAAAAGLSREGIERINAALSNIENAEIEVMEATAVLEQALKTSEFTTLLREAQGSNALGVAEDAIRLENELAGDLLEGWMKTRQAYQDAYKALPEINVSLTPFVEALEQAATPLNALDRATNEGLVDPMFRKIKSLANPPEGVTAEEMAQALADDGVTFKQMFITLVPRLERAISRGMKESKDVGTLKALKDSIYAIAKQQPEYANAIELYGIHKGVFEETAPLQAFSDVAETINPSLIQGSGAVAGEKNAIVAAKRAIEDSLTETNQPYIAPLLAALNVASDAPNEQMAGALVSRAMQGVARAVEGGDITAAREVVDSLAPFASALRSVDEAQYEKFSTMIADLQQLEKNKLSTEQFLAKTNTAYANTLNMVKSTEASRFIYDITGNPEVLENAPKAFSDIFNKFSDSTNVLNRLMQEARDTGNPTVVEGIQAHYLAWLAGSMRAARRTGLKASDEGLSAVNDIKPGALDKLIRDPNSPVLRDLSIIFKDNPDRAAQIVAMLDLQDQVLTGRAVRGETFGSSTNYDREIKKMMDRFTVLAFGVLNPTATVVRNLSEAATKGYRTQAVEATQKTIDMMIAYPDKFTEMMGLVARNELGGARAIMGPLLLREGVGAVTDTTPLVARGVFGAEPNKDRKLPEAWDEYLQTQAALGDLSVNQFDQEMRRLFPDPLNPDAQYTVPISRAGPPRR